MKASLVLVLTLVCSALSASEDYKYHYPFAESVYQLVEKTHTTDNPIFFGQAAGRCAAMFRSMHVLLARDDPSQPHPLLEQYYGRLIDVYRNIGIAYTHGEDSSTTELSETMVKDASDFLKSYIHWMTWNKKISGDYMGKSSILNRELKECEDVLKISGAI